MDIKELKKQLADEQFKSVDNVQLVVSLADLRELWEEWREETEKSLNEAKKEEAATLTPDEVAARLNVTKVTLWRWQRLGYLTPVKVGRKTLYRQSDIANLIAGKEGGK
jgi:excisionase family DNA binding protein